MKVKEVMHKGVDWVGPDTPITEIAKLMSQHDVGSIPIGEDDKLVGMVTDRDIVVRAVAGGRNPSQTRVGEIASRELTTIDPDESVDSAVALMRERSIRRLPVVEDGRPVGIVSLGDLALERDPDSCLGEISAAPPND